MQHDDYTSATTTATRNCAAEAGRVAVILSDRTIRGASARMWKPFLLLLLVLMLGCDKTPGLAHEGRVVPSDSSRIQVLESKFIDLDIKLFLISVDSIQYIVTSDGGIIPHMVIDSCSEIFGIKWKVTPLGVTQW